MNSTTIDVIMLRKMFVAGAKNLDARKEWINELNVFPVPDGDTGTNMTMTIMSAARDVQALPDNVDMMTLCKSISSGSLRGARGNSGVILSQILRGFTKGVRDFQELDAPTIAAGFDKAVETAYKAVMKPKEGTILTVSKGAAQKARELADEGTTDLETFFREILRYAEEVLARTPDMLPVLKQAGVVDSGGQGLVEFLRGALMGFTGETTDLSIDEKSGTSAPGVNVQMRARAEVDADITFGYCTEFIILLDKPLNAKKERDFKQYLESIGNSIVMVADDEICKIHVHSNDPGLALQQALKYGQLSNMKIDNMRMEHREKLFHKMPDGSWAQIKTEINGAAEQTPTYRAGDAVPLMAESGDQHSESDVSALSAYMTERVEQKLSEHKEVGFVAVCTGEGISEIFRDLGVDYVIEGGQTMNPSTADILDAVDQVNADVVYVLPNNKNIILAANQAQIMLQDKDQGKSIMVVPTKTIPQGIAAILTYMPDVSAEDNAQAMKDAIGSVASGELTYAVRDTVIDDVTIRQGDYMGIGDHGILSVGREIPEVAFEMIGRLMDDSKELISIYYGAEIAEAEAEELQERISKTYPSCDVELQYGGQPIYYYIVSAE
ncbi:MAG: DAK2 domain-containing protein [Butyrivibrio sp.]|nr:DAK2 domain-containing protein [Butyrivibrio sp.]